MATHNHPAQIQTEGLQDGCDRCAEHASDPFVTLDDQNLADLIWRTREWMDDRVYPRSATETVAMRHVEDAIRKARTLKRLEQADTVAL